jgi:glucose-1-phosphate thymidylyltransferase
MPGKLLHQEVVGLYSGRGNGAKRLGPMPCSKELFPVGFWSHGEERTPRPKVPCHYLLERIRAASIGQAYIVLREENGISLPIWETVRCWECISPI